MDLSISDMMALAPPPGPLFWFKADAGVTKNGSNQVSNWADQGPNGWDAQPVDSFGSLQGTSAWPVFTSNVVNGLPGMLYNGSGTLLQHLYPAGSHNLPTPDGSPVTVAAIIKPLNANVGLACTFRLNLDDLEFGMRLKNFGFGNCQLPFSSGVNSHWKDIQPPVDYTGQVCVFDWEFYGVAANPQCAVNLNGSNLPLDIVHSDPLTAYSGEAGFSIGYCNAVFGGDNTTLDGYLVELIGYAGTDPTIVANLQTYLRARAGV